MWHRDKNLSRLISSELRGLWNEFDPIGVIHMGYDILDEYDSYQSDTLTCLRSEDSQNELLEYLEYITSEHMGIEVPQKEIELFTKKLIIWFDTVEKRTLEVINQA